MSEFHDLPPMPNGTTVPDSPADLKSAKLQHIEPTDAERSAGRQVRTKSKPFRRRQMSRGRKALTALAALTAIAAGGGGILALSHGGSSASERPPAAVAVSTHSPEAPSNISAKEKLPIKKAFDFFAANIKNTPFAHLSYSDGRTLSDVISNLEHANNEELRQKFMTNEAGTIITNKFNPSGNVNDNFSDLSFQEILDKQFQANTQNSVIGVKGSVFLNKELQISNPQPGTEFDIHNQTVINRLEGFAKHLGFNIKNYPDGKPYFFLTDNTTRVWIQFQDNAGNLLSFSPDGLMQYQTLGR